jgi:hypothetical protein
MSEDAEPDSTSTGAPPIDPMELLDTMWSSLEEKEQLEAYAAFCKCDEPQTKETRAKLLKPLASALRFRPVFVERAPVEKKASFLRRVANQKPFVFYRDDFLRAWLVEHRKPLICGFLDGASVPHEDGFASTDDPPSAEQFAAGIAAVAGRFSERDIALYLVYLAYFGGESGFWGALVEAEGFETHFAALANRTASKEPTLLAEEEAVETEAATEGFTRIDDWLIRLAVSTAFGEENSPDEDTLEDIVEELVELNAGRHRSLFHRGFFHALFRREFQFSFRGENAERRQWYACGVVFGLLRQKQASRCIELLIETERELGSELARSTSTPCGAKLLPQLLGPLLAEGHYDYVTTFVSSQFQRLPSEGARASAIVSVYRESERLLRQAKYPEAERLLDLALGLLELDRGLLPPGFAESLRPDCLRRKAQCQQAKGSFAAAKEILNEAITQSGERFPPNGIADLGLIEGGFRTLAAVLPKAEAGQNGPLLEALRKGAPRFEEAVGRFGEEAINAHLCLGILKTLEAESSNRAQERADHFQHALSGMRERVGAYASQGLRDWAEFLLALALFETMEGSNCQPAQDLVPAAISAPVKFPAYLWERLFEAASLFDDHGAAIAIAEHLMKSRPEVSGSILGNTDLLARNEELLLALLRCYLERRNPVKSVWRKLADLLSPCIKFEAYRAAGLILDRLEELAMENAEFRPELLEILADSDRYSPAWDTADAEHLSVNLLELEGRAAEAAEKLRGQFFRLKVDGQPHELFAARELLDRLADLGPAGESHLELRALLYEEPVEGKNEPLVGHVLYVGGNETQMAYEDRLRREIGEEHPDLELTFYFPGWSSNWGAQLEIVKSAADRADVVVINPLVRTQFGRGLRAHCNAAHPWLPCTGRGFDSLKNAILRAAAWAAKNNT